MIIKSKLVFTGIGAGSTGWPNVPREGNAIGAPLRWSVPRAVAAPATVSCAGCVWPGRRIFSRGRNTTLFGTRRKRRSIWNLCRFEDSMNCPHLNRSSVLMCRRWLFFELLRPSVNQFLQLISLPMLCPQPELPLTSLGIFRRIPQQWAVEDWRTPLPMLLLLLYSMPMPEHS